MANFLASLRASSSALEALQRSVTTSQNNVSNSLTPGYARQRIALKSREFDPAAGLSGGVSSSHLVSARDEFVETAVRRSLSILGEAEQRSTQLEWIENAVNVTDNAGVAATLDRLYGSFTSWSLDPGSMAAKENVLAAATAFATSCNRAADSILRSVAESEEQIRTTLTSIDGIVERIRLYNVDRRDGHENDAGIDALLHSDLESLAELINIQAIWQEDGTVTVLAGTQGALVVGERSYALSVDSVSSDPAPLYTDALAPVVLSDASGNDITNLVDGGKLGALLKFRNETVARYLGDSQHAGDLNQLVKTIADRVNTILADGYSALETPVPLFDTGASPVAAAHAIKVSASVTAAMLRASDQSKVPPVVNGLAQRLGALSHPADVSDMLDGLSYVSYFGRISADAGRALANAQTEAESRMLMSAQARSLREEISGVSLDEEAIRLVEYQRAYQASARIVTTLDEMTEMAVNLGRV